MFANTLLVIALTGQVVTSPTGMLVLDQARQQSAINNATLLYPAWLAQQNAAMRAQNEAFLRAEYQRFAEQQTRLKARKAQLRAKKAPKPNILDKPAPIVLSKQAREEQIKKNLAKNRK